MIDVVVTEHIHELPGRSLRLGQIDAKRLPQSVQGQPLRQTSKLAPMRHHSSQRLGGERLTVAVDQDGLAAPVGRIQDLGQHRRDRHKKPFATCASLVLGLNDIKSVEVTLDTVDEDSAGDPLIPAQARDVAAAIAEPKRQAVTGACRRAELPTVFELRHGLARPCFPAGIGGPPFDGRCGVDFNPVLPQRDIDQLAYAHQQVLGLVWRADEAAKKLFNMDASKVPNRHIPPDERVIWDHPQFQKFFDQPHVFALAGLV